MDWITFRSQLGTPDIEINQIYFDKFINNSTSLVITLWDDKIANPEERTNNYERVLNILTLLKGRGAVQGRDYIIAVTTVETERITKVVTLYTIPEFLSREDWIPEYEK